jgi:DNA-binding beta-propeller fold protein YncE
MASFDMSGICHQAGRGRGSRNSTQRGDAMHYRPVEGWGRLPEGWSFVEATSVAVDATDNVWVFNRGAHPVIMFDREGNFRRAWGEGLIRRAHGITIGPDGALWLTDDLHHTIRKFTPDGALLLTIGDPDTPSTLQGGKPFNRPTHVALCPKTGDVYVSDGYGNSRVHKYDPKGRHLHSWGAPGTDPGCFNLPHNIATDAEGLVYVADRENHRVQVFDGKGQYLTQLNNLHRPCGLFCDRRNGGVLYVGELPTHLAVNAAVPNLGARVSMLTLKGDLVGRIGGPFVGEKPGEFVAPHGCVVDSRGDLYVAEVAWTAKGSLEDPPREIRSLQKFALVR